MARPSDSSSEEEDAAVDLERSHSATRGSTPRIPVAAMDNSANWRAFLQASEDDVAVYDDGDHILAHNGNVPWLDHGLGPAELDGTCVYDFSPPEQREVVKAAFAKVRRDLQTAIFELEAGDGERRRFRVRVVPVLRDETLMSLMTIARDVTELRDGKRAAQTLSSVMGSANDALICIALDGTILEWSAGATRVFGYSADEMRGRPIKRLTPPGHADDLRAHLALVARGETVRGAKSRRSTKDGSVIDVEIHCSPIVWNDAVHGAVCVVRDVTDAARVQQKLELANRMVAMGTVTASVAHEINNPLTYVLGNLHLIDEVASTARATLTDADLERLRAAVGHANAGMDRVRAIANDLKAVSRNDRGEGPVDLRRAIDRAMHMARHQILRRARLVSDFGDLPFVTGNETRLGQVLLNLLINAGEAIPDGNAQEHEVRVSAHTEQDESVVIEVRDSGRGMNESERARAFDSGLGLAVSRGIVTSMGGTLEVESERGKGSVFLIRLPTARREIKPSPPPSPHEVRARVLVIDDQVLISNSIGMLLTNDHDVTSLTSARDALRRIREGEAYDVVVCDLMMPDMSGMDLYSALREESPAMAERMIFMTGGAFTSTARDFLAVVQNPRIDKPLHFDTLRRLIRGVLEARTVVGLP